jgi:hypothetical protein
MALLNLVDWYSPSERGDDGRLYALRWPSWVAWGFPITRKTIPDLAQVVSSTKRSRSVSLVNKLVLLMMVL